jgi:hypothetical protein
MRHIIFILTISLFLISCGQTDTKQKELELKERELALKEKELNQQQKIVSTTNQTITKAIQSENEKLQENKESEKEAVNKYLGNWVSGSKHLTITKFGKSYKLMGCENCPFSAVLKDEVLYVSAGIGEIACTYDENSDHILLDGTEYKRVNK